jgi:uncharacterized protein (TIGR02246 family)
MNGRTSKIRVSLAVASGAMTLVLAGLTMLFAVTGAQTPSLDVAPTAADEAAVRAIPRMVVDAWARGDGAGVAAAFMDDVDFIAGDGRLVQGRDAIVPYFQEQFDGWLAGSRSVAEVVNVRFVRDDVAVVHTLGGIVFPGETEVQPNWVGIQTWIVVEDEGEWRATAYQNSRVSPDVQAATPLPE